MYYNFITQYLFFRHKLTHVFSLFTRSKNYKEEQVLAAKDLNVCSIVFQGEVVPKTRSWEDKYGYVFNPSDVNACLLYAIYQIKNTKI